MRIGKAVELKLDGKRYKLWLSGCQNTGEGEVGSGYTAGTVADFFWFEGSGRITKPDGTAAMFNFTTWSEERSGRRTLEQFVFSSDKWVPGGYIQQLPIVANRMPELVDELCERTLAEIEQSESPVPTFCFGKWPHKWFEENAFLYDENGQAQLAMA